MGDNDPARIKTGNLFEAVPRDFPEELFTEIVKGPGVRIERIVSSGQVTPEGEWCDQESHEWVMVVRGHARLAFEGGSELEMQAGDHVLIPAHCRHRVMWTYQDEPTVWLAVHFSEKELLPRK